MYASEDCEARTRHRNLPRRGFGYSCAPVRGGTREEDSRRRCSRCVHLCWSSRAVLVVFDARHDRDEWRRRYGSARTTHAGTTRGRFCWCGRQGLASEELAQLVEHLFETDRGRCSPVYCRYPNVRSRSMSVSFRGGRFFAGRERSASDAHAFSTISRSAATLAWRAESSRDSVGSSSMS